MERKAFRTWLPAIDTLSAAQKAGAGEVLTGRPVGDASLAAAESLFGEDRTCPHCGTPGAVANSKARGMQRYLCRSCKRTFGAGTGTPLSGLHHKDVWLTFGECLANGDTVAASAERCGIAVSTAFRWRHRFLAAVRTGTEKLRGIVEADETLVPESRKGDRSRSRVREGKSSAQPPARKARKRGGKATRRGLSDEQVPVLVATDRSGATVSAVLPAVNAGALRDVLEPVMDKDALPVTDCGTSYPPCAAAMGVSHEALNQSSGERVRGELHIRTVNNRHSRLRAFLRSRRGIATTYLASYLRWFRLIALHRNSTTLLPRQHHGRHDCVMINTVRE